MRRGLLGKSALQILHIVISSSLAVCVCVCPYVSFCVNVCYQVAKILKKSSIWIPTFLVEWRKSPTSTPLPRPSRSKSVLAFSNFANTSQTVRDSGIHCCCHQIGSRLFAMKKATANVVHHDLDRHFQGHTISGNIKYAIS